MRFIASLFLSCASGTLAYVAYPKFISFFVRFLLDQQWISGSNQSILQATVFGTIAYVILAYAICLRMLSVFMTPEEKADEERIKERVRQLQRAERQRRPPPLPPRSQE